jgi:predicted dithiol-disulfide oxidoreductase (DUF899 family)
MGFALVFQLRQRLQRRLPCQFRQDKTPLEYNDKDKQALESATPYIRTGADCPGASVFWNDGGRVLHTYSAYASGLHTLLGTSAAGAPLGPAAPPPAATTSQPLDI